MDAKDCNPAYLKIIAKYYGKYYSLQYLRDLCGITREGVSFLDISYAARQISLRNVSVKATLPGLLTHISPPCIIHWDNSHFIIVHKIANDHRHIKRLLNNEKTTLISSKFSFSKPPARPNP